MGKDSLFSSFKNAWRGLIIALQTERNLRLHFICAILVLIVLIIFQIGGLKLALILLTIGLVLVAELINTTIENLVDLIQPEFHEIARNAKDIAAGAVLTAAIVAVLVGVVILGPYFIQLFF